jgi:hypothetical protein
VVGIWENDNQVTLAIPSPVGYVLVLAHPQVSGDKQKMCIDPNSVQSHYGSGEAIKGTKALIFALGECTV